MLVGELNPSFSTEISGGSSLRETISEITSRPVCGNVVLSWYRKKTARDVAIPNAADSRSLLAVSYLVPEKILVIVPSNFVRSVIVCWSGASMNFS